MSASEPLQALACCLKFGPPGQAVLTKAPEGTTPEDPGDIARLYWDLDTFREPAEQLISARGRGHLDQTAIVGAEILCHQAIFMNHPTSAVTPLDPELVQAGDAVGQRAERRGLLQGAVRPVGNLSTD